MTAPMTARTPLAWRAVIAAAIAALTAGAYLTTGDVSPRVQSLFGVAAFLLVAVLFSANVRAINWRVVATGLALQVGLALVIQKVEPVYRAFDAVGNFVQKFLSFTESPTNTLKNTLAWA